MDVGSIRDVVNAEGHGLTNYTIRGKCSRCGNCCTDYLYLNKSEIKKITHYVKKHRLQDMTRSNCDVSFVCPFLDLANHVCAIYPARPEICQSFICSMSNERACSQRDRINNNNRKLYSMRALFFKKKR